MTILKLIISAIVPVLLAVVLYLIEKNTKFNKLPYWLKQVIIGTVFGASACLATEFGILTNGVVLNVRGASPLTAGLIFGGPAGIIAGVIGGVYRWVSVAWGIGSYTRIACSLGTIIAGVVGALCRKVLFDNKKTSWFYGLFIGSTTEVLHMLLVFITHMDDIATAFDVVKACAIPMIVANGISVMLSVFVVTVLGKEKVKKTSRQRQITQTFSASLLICVIVAFTVTSLFSYALQDRISEANVEKLLSINVSDVKADIMAASDNHILSVTKSITREIEKSDLNNLPENLSKEQREALRDELNTIFKDYSVADINIIDKNGIIVLSTNPDFDGYDMKSKADGQAQDFLQLLGGKRTYVQAYGPVDYDNSIYRKYAGVALKKGGFVQVGYDAEYFQDSINSSVELAAQNRHIDDSGFVFIINDKTFEIISTTSNEITKETISKFKNSADQIPDDKVLEATNDAGEPIYFMQERCEGYIIVGCLPVEDAHFARGISTYIGIFMQIVVFVTLFVLIYIMIKKIIVDNIHKINDSLAKIASGNLDTQVDVRVNEEFSSLSDDINTTVDTLKDYIADAETRVAKELEFAKTIQLASLPNVFPPYPNHRDFEIYALMDTAKEVGGDFYDFYFVGENKLLMLVADVSGKGIPAAMFMMTAKTMIKSLAETGLPVEEIMTQANQKLCEMNEAGMFVTVWVGIVDLSNGKINYVSAGHNPPLVKHQNGEFEYIKGRSGLVLAGMEGIKYRPMEAQMLPNDKIFLYTDGVTEATDKNNQLYGEERLKNYLNSRDNYDVEATCKELLVDINKFVGDAPQFDDITMLMFTLEEINNYNELTLSPTVDSIPRVTEFVENWMLRTKVDEKTVRKVNVIVDEIYSNVANYSNSMWARVFYTRDTSSMTLVFTDNGIQYNPLEAQAPDITLSAEEREIGGLGIMMVKKMASDIKYEYVDGQNKLTIIIGLE